MIKKIGIENFRTFWERVEFTPSIITLLTGPNNTGKSCFNKSLLLLMNAFKLEAPQASFLDPFYNSFDFLKLDKEMLKILGNFQSNINRLSKKDFIAYDFTINYQIFDQHIFENLNELSNNVHTFNFLLKYSNKDQNQPLDNKEGEIIPLTKFAITYREEILFDFEKVQVSELFVGKDFVENDFVWSDVIGIRKNSMVFRKFLLCLRNQEKEVLWKEFEKVDLKSLLRDIENPVRYSSENPIPIKFEIPLDKDYLFLTARNNRPDLLLHTSFSYFVFEKDIFKKQSGLDEEALVLLVDLDKKGIKNKKQFLKAYVEFEHKLIEIVIEKKLKSYTPDKNEFFGGAYDIQSKKELFQLFDYTNYDNLDVRDILDLIKNIDDPLADLFWSEINQFSENPTEKDQIDNENYEKRKYGKTKENYTLFCNYNENKIPKLTYFDLNEVIKIISDRISSIYREFANDLGSFLSLYQVELLETDSVIRKSVFLQDDLKQDSTFYQFALIYIQNDYELSYKFEFINKWIKKIGAGDELILRLINENSNDVPVGVSYYITNGNEKIPLDSLGRGLQKFIRLILRISITSNHLDHNYSKGYWGTSFQDRMILLEEPEANLHPNLQSILAEMIIEAALILGINFVIETHSEYLIRKLQFLVAKRKISTGIINIYYFNLDEYVSSRERKVKEIKINEFGGLTDSFGPGFFDEATHLQFELLKLNKGQSN